MSEELTRSGEGLFHSARRGYDRREVDAYVAQLQQQIRELQAQQQSPDAAVRGALERVGVEVTEVLKQAHATAEAIVAAAAREADQHIAAVRREADEYREQAAREADEYRERATREATHVTAVAEERVHELDLDTDRIWGERERIVDDVRDLARQLNQLADIATERFPQDVDYPQAPSGPDRGLRAGRPPRTVQGG